MSNSKSPQSNRKFLFIFGILCLLMAIYFVSKPGQAAELGRDDGDESPSASNPSSYKSEGTSGAGGKSVGFSNKPSRSLETPTKSRTASSSRTKKNEGSANAGAERDKLVTGGVRRNGVGESFPNGFAFSETTSGESVPDGPRNRDRASGSLRGNNGASEDPPEARMDELRRLFNAHQEKMRREQASQ